MRDFATATSIENTVASFMRKSPSKVSSVSDTASIICVRASSGRRIAARMREALAYAVVMMSCTSMALSGTAGGLESVGGTSQPIGSGCAELNGSRGLSMSGSTMKLLMPANVPAPGGTTGLIATSGTSMPSMKMTGSKGGVRVARMLKSQAGVRSQQAGLTARALWQTGRRPCGEMFGRPVLSPA